MDIVRKYYANAMWRQSTIELISKVQEPICASTILSRQGSNPPPQGVCLFFFTPVFLCTAVSQCFSACDTSVTLPGLAERWHLHKGKLRQVQRPARTYTYTQRQLSPPFSLHGGYHHFHCLHCTFFYFFFA